MPIRDYKNTRLNIEQARKLIFRLTSFGKITMTGHARKRLIERNIILNDVLNVLLSPAMRVFEGEFENDGYRYRCSTRKFVVVIGFSIHGDSVVIITAFKAEGT